MEVIFYYNASDDRKIVKDLLEGVTLEGELRDEANIMSPTIRFKSTDFMRYNYCYIPTFQRYYSVTEINAYRNGLWDVSMAVDVLMSFKGDILRYPCIVDKQSDVENGDEYIDDASLITDNVMFSTVYPYSEGFNDEPEYILITAG